MTRRSSVLTRRAAIVAGAMFAIAAGGRGAFAQAGPGGEASPAGNTWEGRTVLVTGPTDGLGRAVALELGALGATVIVHGRNRERGEAVMREIEDAGRGSAVFYRADLASLDEVRALADTIAANHDRLDLLINNAGIWTDGSDARRTSDDGHELVFAVNYLAGFLLTHRLLPLMKRSAPARIVNVASLAQQPIDFDD